MKDYIHDYYRRRLHRKANVSVSSAAPTVKVRLTSLSQT